MDILSICDLEDMLEHVPIFKNNEKHASMKRSHPLVADDFYSAEIRSEESRTIIVTRALVPEGIAGLLWRCGLHHPFLATHDAYGYTLRDGRSKPYRKKIPGKEAYNILREKYERQFMF